MQHLVQMLYIQSQHIARVAFACSLVSSLSMDDPCKVFLGQLNLNVRVDQVRQVLAEQGVPRPVGLWVKTINSNELSIAFVRFSEPAHAAVALRMHGLVDSRISPTFVKASLECD